jgi:MerR family transcriptional regulator, light-induced transcriptional regulator
MITSTILSTADVASLLKVNESTIKRWTEKGILHCYKTPGGHRKYSQEDVAAFIDHYGYKVDEPVAPKETAAQPVLPVSADYAILTKDHASLASVLTEILLRGNDEETYQFLNLLRINRYTLVELYDKIIAESLRRIGSLWVERVVNIEQEHIATNCMLTAIRRLQTVIPKKERTGMTALCGCFEGEFHEVGVTCVRNVLDAEGWNTIYLGTNLPVESFIQAVGRYRPQLVCVSSTTPKTKFLFRRDCQLLHEAARQWGAKFLVGGSATMQGGKSKIDADYIAESIGGLLGWLQAQL